MKNKKSGCICIEKMGSKLNVWEDIGVAFLFSLQKDENVRILLRKGLFTEFFSTLLYIKSKKSIQERPKQVKIYY